MEHKESIQVGAGWKSESVKGLHYISCKLNNGVKFAIFVNKGKTDDKHPDYKLIMDIDSATTMDLLDEYTLRKTQELAQANEDRLNRAVEDIPFGE